MFLEPGSRRENGSIESFNGKLRDELLKGELFFTLQEAQILIQVRRPRQAAARQTSPGGPRDSPAAGASPGAGWAAPPASSPAPAASSNRPALFSLW